MKSKKILLVMCHWLGDTFWAMQIIPELKLLYPNGELWAIVKPFSKDLLYTLIEDHNIIISKNITSDRHREKFSLLGYLKELKNVRLEKFDIAIDLTSNRYSAIFLRLSGIKHRIGLNIHHFSFLYTLVSPSLNESKHLSFRPWDIFSKLENQTIQRPQWLFPPKSRITQKVLENECKINVSEKLALLCPCAGWEAKQWDIKNFAACGKYLIEQNYKIIISGTEKERSICEQLNFELDGEGTIFIKPLEYFITLAKYLKLAITNDNGIAHILGALGIKTITIFLTTEISKCAPIGKNAIPVKPQDATAKEVISLLNYEE